MNSFSDWQSGNTLRRAFGSTNESQVSNFSSAEDLVKNLLGSSYVSSPQEPPIDEKELKAAKDRAKELSDAVEKLTEIASKVEKKIEEVREEPAPEPEAEPIIEQEEEVEASKAYRIFRDRDENFECKISIQGAGLSATQARIVLDCDLWNLTFYGKLYKDGRCIIPIKKSIPLPEGQRGRARLEVIVDDQIFVPWEDDFVVEGSKKVKVELKEQKSVKVSFNHSSEE